MADVRRQLRLEAAPDAVWSVVTDFQGMRRWFLGVRRVTCDAAPAAGVERRLSTLLGHTYVERIETWEPGRGFSWSVVNLPWFARRWDASLRLDPQPGGTEVAWRIEIDLRAGTLGRVLDRLLVTPLVAAVLGLSLRRLRAAIAATPALRAATPRAP